MSLTLPEISVGDYHIIEVQQNTQSNRDCYLGYESTHNQDPYNYMISL